MPSPPGDAWSSVNNSAEDEKITDFAPDVEDVTDDTEQEMVNFENMDVTIRRKLVRRLREMPIKRVKTDSPYDPGSVLDVA